MSIDEKSLATFDDLEKLAKDNNEDELVAHTQDLHKLLSSGFLWNKGEKNSFIRLKELAKANENHRQALEFHILERRLHRKLTPWRKEWFAQIFDMAFDCTSEYGSSIGRPFFCWLAVMGIFGLIYAFCIPDTNLKEAFTASLIFSAPVITSVKSLLPDAFSNASLGLTLVVYFQSILSLIFLFLIGLGFRNRFKS